MGTNFLMVVYLDPVGKGWRPRALVDFDIVVVGSCKVNLQFSRAYSLVLVTPLLAIGASHAAVAIWDYRKVDYSVCYTNFGGLHLP